MILWTLYTVSEAYEDSQYTVIFDHKPTVYPRLITGLTVSYLWYVMQQISVLQGVAFGFVLATFFWFVFELSRNLFDGHYFYYIGNTSVTDRWLKEWEWPIFWLRLWLMGFAFGLYYYDQLNVFSWLS